MTAMIPRRNASRRAFLQPLVLLAALLPALVTTVPARADDGKRPATGAENRARPVRLWEDPRTHQVFTEPGPGRVPVEVAPAPRKEKGSPTEKTVVLGGRPIRLRISGDHFLGFVVRDPETGPTTQKFETRRNHLQVISWFDEKNFLRLTLDTYQETGAPGTSGNGSWVYRLKYAYLWLADILPHTGIEIGQVARPWIGYEEHHGWWYRSISKTFVEAAEGAHLFNSADLGINLVTATDHFSSAVALVNGEDFTSASDGNGLSLEWRLTWHALGTGRRKVDPRRDRYLDVSTFGIRSDDDERRTGSPGGTDFLALGIHFAFNTPRFLVAGTWLDAENEDWAEFEGHGFSVDWEVRPTDRWAILGRYDNWDQSSVRGNAGGDRTNTILGVAWRYDRFVRFILNTQLVDYDEGDPENAGIPDETRYYATAEVHW